MVSQRDKDPKPHAPAPAPHDSDRAARSQRRHPVNEGGTDELGCVRLTRKFADVIDGVDLSNAHVGDQLDLSPHDAEVLIAEGWAERDTRLRTSDVRALADDAVASDNARRSAKQTKKKPT